MLSRYVAMLSPSAPIGGRHAGLIEEAANDIIRGPDDVRPSHSEQPGVAQEQRLKYI